MHDIKRVRDDRAAFVSALKRRPAYAPDGGGEEDNRPIDPRLFDRAAEKKYCEDNKLTLHTPEMLNDVKEHFDLGEALGLMDFERAAKVSGARFVYLKGALAKLER